MCYGCHLGFYCTLHYTPQAPSRRHRKLDSLKLGSDSCYSRSENSSTEDSECTKCTSVTSACTSATSDRCSRQSDKCHGQSDTCLSARSHGQSDKCHAPSDKCHAPSDQCENCLQVPGDRPPARGEVRFTTQQQPLSRYSRILPGITLL